MGKLNINDFLRSIRQHFGNVQYKAISNDGIVFKSKGWDHAKIQFDKTEFTKFNKQVKRTGF